MLEITPTGEHWPINEKNIKHFHHFVNKGVNYWFGKDIIKNWVTNKGYGFHDFLKIIVQSKMSRVDKTSVSVS